METEPGAAAKTCAGGRGRACPRRMRQTDSSAPFCLGSGGRRSIAFHVSGERTAKSFYRRFFSVRYPSAVLPRTAPSEGRRSPRVCLKGQVEAAVVRLTGGDGAALAAPAPEVKGPGPPWQSPPRRGVGSRRRDERGRGFLSRRSRKEAEGKSFSGLVLGLLRRA